MARRPIMAGPDGNLRWATDAEMNAFSTGGDTRRSEVLTATTNAAGVAAFVFSPPFAQPPTVDVNFPGQGTEQFFRISSLSASGCSVHVFQRSGLSVLAVTLLALATSNVAGASITIRAEER